MLKRVRIKEVGDTNFIIDEPVEWWVFEEENRRVMEKGGTPATAESLFLGITKASLITDSFISAASFQDTTKVLTQASIEGRVDYLRGLKENVIMGRIIPAGTGLLQVQELRDGCPGALKTEPEEPKVELLGGGRSRAPPLNSGPQGGLLRFQEKLLRPSSRGS